MIEIPKYTIDTYDPTSSAINRQSDFTRRIPTGLSDKQMARAEKLCRQLERSDIFAYVSRRGEEEIIIL